MPDIAIISAIYPPEPQVSARMAHDLANHLAKQGHRVTVLCPQPSRPLNADYNQYQNKPFMVETVEGTVRVVRLPSFAAPQSRLFSRLRESFSFGLHAISFLKKLSTQPDVVYMNSWPIASQAMIAAYARRRAIPLVMQIMDLYPESLTEKLPTFAGLLVNWPLRKLDTWVASSAYKVIVISEAMRSIFIRSRRVATEKIITIPTWQDDALFVNVASRQECCKKYGVPEQPFTFMYLGNIGPVAGVDFLIRCFAEAALPDAQLIIAGDGTTKIFCQELAKQLKLANVYFISDPDVKNVPLLQVMADVCMLPMKRGTGTSSIPSKLPAYMFSGKPVIATVDADSDTARSVVNAACGWVGPAEDVGWMIKTMRDVANLPVKQLEDVGQRGKSYGLTHFSKSSGVTRLAQTVINNLSTKQDHT